jgi:predicted P-loop ATPase
MEASHRPSRKLAKESAAVPDQSNNDKSQEDQALPKNDAKPERAAPKLTVVPVLPRPKKEKSPPWHNQLWKTGKNCKPNQGNIMIFLRNADEWRDTLHFDELSRRIEIRQPPPSPPWPAAQGEWTPRPWDDQDDRLLAEWLQKQKLDAKIAAAADAAETRAREQPFHPIRDWLQSLVWDDTPRIGRWLHDYFGAELSPYHEAVGARWLISAVARAMQPGCKVDTMLILEGAQGLGKGRCFEALVKVRGWYTDGIKEFGSLESARQLAGKWIIESSELEGIKGTSGRKAINEGVKAFMSRSIDNYRAPYGRRAQDHPRQCVFAGTTNQSEIFTDTTGNRRFWPVKCNTARPDELLLHRDQLWAEAVVNYREGVRWWLDTSDLRALADAAAEERFEVDILEPIVAEILTGQDFTTIRDLAPIVFDKEAQEITPGEQERIKAILIRLGFEKGKSFKKATYNKRGYLRKKSTEISQSDPPSAPEPGGGVA